MSDDASIWEPRNPVTEVNNFSSVVKEAFTATVGQQIFNLTAFAYVPGTNSLLVYKNGLLLVPGVDYSDTDNTSFTLTAGAALSDVILAIGFIGSINAVVDPYYLGPKAAAPTEDNQGITLDATHEGYTYWDTGSKNWWTWTGTIWQLTTSSVATSANLVTIADAGSKFVGTEVETALQECVVSTFLASTANGEGASGVGVEDAGSLFTGADLETVLQEIGAVIPGSAATTVTIAGAATASINTGALSFTAGKPIRTTLDVVGAAPGGTISLMLNSDTTATNYDRASVTDGGAVSTGNDAVIGVVLTNSQNAFLDITLMPNATTGETLVIINAGVKAATVQVVQATIVYTVTDVITNVGFTAGAVMFGIDTKMTVHQIHK